jgi:3-dehydroquinate synthase
MKHLIVDHTRELMIILNDFFLKGYSRKSEPNYLPSYDRNIFALACQIYKRGFLNSCQTQVEIRSIPLPSVLDKSEFEVFFATLSFENCFFIIDENLFLKQPSLQKLIQKNRFLVYSPQETTKSMETVTHFLKSIPENIQTLFALGGGITLDIAGFVAGLLNIKLFYLPSTLLASVDAGIGGKTGVNFFPYGKNQVGLFYEAEKLFCVPEYFFSLPFDDILCGLVEAIKHSWIFGEFANDHDFILRIYHNQASKEDYSFLVRKSILYKSFIVNQDLFESKDIRTSLNLGHTLAHVLEALGEEGTIQYLPHGIAVAHGLSFILKSGLVILPNELSHITNLIHELTDKYPIKVYQELTQNKIEKYLAQDKKNESLHLCSLSLPAYGHFSLLNKQSTHLPVTQNFPLNHISNLMLEYINRFS